MCMANGKTWQIQVHFIASQIEYDIRLVMIWLLYDINKNHWTETECPSQMSPIFNKIEWTKRIEIACFPIHFICDIPDELWTTLDFGW